MKLAPRTPDPALIARCLREGTVCDEPLESLGTHEAEAFQRAVAEIAGYAPCGYKIGATNAASQRFLGASAPIFGPVFAERLFDSGAEYKLPVGVLGLECEFGFRLGRDYPAPGESLALSSLKSAVAECFPAIEVAGRRVQPSVPITHSSVVADLCFAAAIVRGAPVPEWRNLDLCSLPVTAAVDGTVAASGDGSRVLGDPLASLLWLAGALAARGRTLQKHDVVITGSCTGITPIAPGQHVEACFGHLAPVGLHLT